MNDCEMTSFTNEDASVAAIRKWVGVPPSRVSGEITFCDYQERGQARMPSDPNIDAGTHGSGRRTRMGLVVIQSPSGASIQLAHTLPMPNPPR